MLQKMKFLKPLLVLIAIESSAKCDIDVEDPLFKELPTVFRIDDDASCKARGKTHCKLFVKLRAVDENNKSAHWRVIEATIEDPKFYNHDELFHAICVNDFCPRVDFEASKLQITRQLSECYQEKYAKLGLKFDIVELDCDEKFQPSPTSFDGALLAAAVVYLGGVAFATIKNSPHPLVNAFSVTANWKKLRAMDTKPDIQKLKFIQGMRFYNMLLIILCHTVASYIGGFVSNTEYFETMHQNHVWRLMTTLFLFLVQTFFTISAFLLTYHVCQTVGEYKSSKIKYILLAFINRYLRILPPVLVMILIFNSASILNLFQGPIKDMYADREYQRCAKNSWTNLLFINNHYDESEMCYFPMWYLAADTQLYLLSLMVLLVIWKFREKSRVIFLTTVGLGISIPMILCYKYGFDIIYRITPENAKNESYRSFQFATIYAATYSNLASYMVGVAFGWLYYAIETNPKSVKFNQYFWIISFAMLPITVVFLASEEHSRPVSIILSGIVKPGFALGIGAGILAMSQQKCGLAKKICELKPAVFLGNFTYSTYVVHFGIVFYRTATTNQPFYVSDFILITSFVRDAVLSILCGLIMHLLVEMPWIQVQKMYVPQIRNGKNGTQCCKKAK